MLNFKLEIRNEGTLEKFFLEERGKKQEKRGRVFIITVHATLLNPLHFYTN